MRRSALFILPFLSACMGGGLPDVLSDGGSRDDSGIVTPGTGTGNGTTHEGFGILLNDTRGANSVLQVYEDSRLNEAAQGHADEMSRFGYMAHTDRQGGTAGDRALAVGYDWNFIAENLARGYYSDTAVIEAWMNSASHRSSMLDSRAEDFGLGYANGYWVLMLGREFPTADIAEPVAAADAIETPQADTPVDTATDVELTVADEELADIVIAVDPSDPAIQAD